MIEPRPLQDKLREPVLHKERFARLDIQVRGGGGHVAQIGTICGSVSNALVAYCQKYGDEASKKAIEDILNLYDLALLEVDPQH